MGLFYWVSIENGDVIAVEPYFDICLIRSLLLPVLFGHFEIILS